MNQSHGSGWFVVAVAVVLTVAVVQAAWRAPETPSRFFPTPTGIANFATSPTPTPTVPAPTSTPTASPAPSPTPIAMPSPTPTSTNTPAPTATPTATPSPTAETTLTPTPLRPGRPWPTPDVSRAHTHYWLRRPISPASRCIASAFYPYGTDGAGQYLVHHGADFPAKTGTPLHATADGVIVVAGSDREQVYGLFPNFYGNLVVERLDETYRGQPVFVLFGHLSKVEAKVGQRVSAGDEIGRVGAAGIAMGPHLHLEVRIGRNDYGATRNPEFWLRMLPGRGTLVGRLLTPDGRAWPGATLYVRRADEPKRVFQTLYTYVDDPQVNPDDEWGENFLWADAPAGDYLLETPWGKLVPFSIEPGGTAFLDVRVAP